MLGFRLQLRAHPDGRLIFAIPIGYKLLLLLIGVLILVSLIVTREEGSGSILVRENTIPLIICLVSLLGAAYHECWIFDKTQRRVIHQNGLVFIHSNKVYDFTDLERIEISQFIKGRTGATRQTRRSLAFRPIITLSLQLRDGRSFRLENYRSYHRQKVETTARSIAEYCRITYRNQMSAAE